MADEPKPPTPPAASPAEAGAPATPAKAAADKPPSAVPGEPLKAEPSRTDAPGAGTSAAPVAPPRAEPPAPKPENPTAAQTATTSETSSATGAVTPPASAATAATAGKPAAAAAAAAAGKPAAPVKPLGAEAAAAKPPAAKAAHPPPAPAPPSGPPDPPPPAGTEPPPYIATLQSAIPGSVTAVSYWVGDWTIIVPAARILDIATHLRDAPDALFDFCSDVTATDWPPRKEGRFDVVYCLYSIVHRRRLRVKVIVGADQPLASVTGVWPAANWLEREVYDMFGVNFTGHPDRRRILMPDDWQGFPQRKDYPLEGPGELLMENPIDWLKLRQAREEADIE
jgi:NADH-quinone oxidoreductase subunit C